MAKSFPDDILAPSGAGDRQTPSRPLAALIPISVALVGVAAILLGGISAQTTVGSGAEGVDPIVTGSIGKAASPQIGNDEHAR